MKKEDRATADLETVRRILLTARIDAACDHWHLDERAVPPLRKLADRTGEENLAKALEHTTKAGEHFEAARAALAMAMGFVGPSPEWTER
jgi:hypothetical protein